MGFLIISFVEYDRIHGRNISRLKKRTKPINHKTFTIREHIFPQNVTTSAPSCQK